MIHPRFPFLCQRLFNTPLAIHPRKCEIIVAALADRLGITGLQRISGEVLAFGDYGETSYDDTFMRPGGKPDPGYDLIGGAAVIPVTGTLVHHHGAKRPVSGMQGYDAIREAFIAARADSKAKAIVFNVDSPGGEVAGVFDLADEIFAARGDKPMVAIADEVAYSAAYALASAADVLIVPRTGGVGSIGIVCCHMDLSQALAGAGVTVSFIQYGAKKTHAAPEMPLADAARADLQADVDAMGELFVETVARNRRIPAKSVRDTEAGSFLGSQAVELGLADAVMAPAAAFQDLLSRLD